jgi:hypothetical protein
MGIARNSLMRINELKEATNASSEDKNQLSKSKNNE